MELDLRGMTVLTEAATGAYVCSPIIAAVAGADRVIAVTKASPFGDVADVKAQTNEVAALADAPPVIEIHIDGSLAHLRHADIITNLGFVRPIDRRAAEQIKKDAVVCLMCEAWERRPDDVDVDACQNRGIPVLGTNESLPNYDVFSYCGILLTKLLLEAGVEVLDTDILIVSTDKFGEVAETWLGMLGARTHRLSELSVTSELVDVIDAVVVADYTRTDMIIGRFGDLTPREFVTHFPSAAIVHLAGRIDTAELEHAGVLVHPSLEIGARRMTTTLSHVGPAPVIKLHAAGLRVGQWAVNELRSGKGNIAAAAGEFPLAQILPGVSCE